MDKDGNRDAALERLLRQSLGPLQDQSPGSCLDAETLAAWRAGALSRAARAAAESHMSECARCQSMAAAFARSLPDKAPRPSWTRKMTVRWLVPLTAASTATLLWVAVARQDRPPTREEAAAPASAPVTPAPEPADAARGRLAPPSRGTPDVPNAASERATENRAVDKRRAEQSETRRQASVAEGAGPLSETVTVAAESPSVASSPPAADASARTIEVISPVPSVRWRVGTSGLIQRSSDAGATWETQSAPTTADLLAGAAVSDAVCWVVGRAGTVLVTFDGRDWRAVTFPQTVDLVALRTSDARTVTVTTAGGQLFRTTDGGATWAVVQGF